MKNIYYIVLCIGLLLTGCSQNEYKGYEADNYINFTQDSSENTIFSFFFVPEDEYQGTVKLPLEIIAPLIDGQRAYRIAFVEEESSAQKGIDFIMPEDVLYFGENRAVDTLEITVLRPKESEHEVTAVFELLPSDDFALGIPAKIKNNIVITNKISQPSWWDQWHITSGLGTYSALKYKAFYDLTGVSDLDYKNRDDITQSEVRALILEFKYWLKENPQQDVNGPMEVAMKG